VSVTVETLRPGGPESPARPVVSRARTSRRILTDRWASRLVVVGGIIIIASILAILFVIAAEVYPLFRKPTLEFRGRAGFAASVAPSAPRTLGADEYREIAFEVTEAGMLEFLPLKGGRSLAGVPVPGLAGARVTAATPYAKSGYAIGTTDGRMIPLEMKFDVSFPGGVRTVTPVPEFGEAVAVDPGRHALRRLAHATPESGGVTVAQTGPTELVVQAVVEKKALVGGGTKEISTRPVTVPDGGEITALALDARAEDLFIGTARGTVVRYDLRDPGSAVSGPPVTVSSRPGAAVTALAFLIGDRTLVVGDGAGGVSTWQLLGFSGGGERRLARIHTFESHPGPVIAIDASKRDKGFVTADGSGRILVHYGTSGRTMLAAQAEGGSLQSVFLTPKGDGLLAAVGAGTVAQWAIGNPHPEITLETLFAKVWYEGYQEPAYVWQSTGGTDDFEPKFSLTPLIYGTLKGTFYALMFAVPLALLAALYVSEFMHPVTKGYVKPVVEIMAALPSVVLGFLAGLWLAPMVERIVPGLFLMPLVVPVFILGALLLWRLVPMAIRGRFRAGSEVALTLPVVIAGTWASFALGALVEATLLGGNYRGWLQGALGLTYDQRNSLVVGIAMGFAVIPLIFTIAEDSLSNVPQHLRAGSLALGATRWQTALRIVLPSASPGIFSAVMIGFGRAVGETMIVLMATGNTPVMEWSIFNGFRALSANVAVELPEAPEGGTLFRVLFVAAFLLFCFTFVVNTAAELVRLRLRKRYRYL
jgi:phosphate transport system permease protein